MMLNNSKQYRYKCHSLLLLFLFPLSHQAQNLVHNPGFEIFTPVKDFKFTEGSITVDYFTEIDAWKGIKIPEAYVMGKREFNISPLSTSDSSSVRIISFCKNCHTTGLLYQLFENPLEKDTVYSFSIMIQHGLPFEFISKKLDVCLYEELLTTPLEIEKLTCNQIFSFDIPNDSLVWFRLDTSFVATGKEKGILIGNAFSKRNGKKNPFNHGEIVINGDGIAVLWIDNIFLKPRKSNIQTLPVPLRPLTIRQHNVELRYSRAIKFTFSFDKNNSHLSLNDLNIVEMIAGFDNQIRMIFIIGHADEKGESEDNDLLSRIRAFSVRKELIKKGVPESKIVTVYYGERGNRRAVEIIVHLEK